jgi:hypothetical protein
MDNIEYKKTVDDKLNVVTTTTVDPVGLDDKLIAAQADLDGQIGAQQAEINRATNLYAPRIAELTAARDEIQNLINNAKGLGISTTPAPVVEPTPEPTPVDTPPDVVK